MSKVVDAEEELTFKQLFAASMIAALSIHGLQTQDAKADTGIGGGATFPNESFFPFIEGQDGPLSASFYVQNIGDDDVELELFHDSREGIVIEPAEDQQSVLAPGESTYFLFDVSVDSLVPAGEYPVILNLRQRVNEEENLPGSNYYPALAAAFTVQVVGASAFVDISAVSQLTGEPAIGNLSLFYQSPNGIEVLIKEESQTSGLAVDVVPGEYRASFNVPNLQTQSVDFTIEDGESRDILLEIPTLDFIALTVSPTRDERDVIQFVSLGIDVYNNLRPLPGPLDLGVRIRREGEIVEDFLIATISQLPEGQTLQRATYNPESGFEQGQWSFEFFITNNDFFVFAPNVINIQSPGLLQSYFREILLVVGALVIAGLLMPRRWWLILLRRRKKKDEDLAQSRKIELPKISLPKLRLPAISLPKVEMSRSPKPAAKPIAAKVIARTKVSKDPLQFAIDLLRKKEQLENQGLRSLSFTYDLDKIYAAKEEAPIKRSTGEPYTNSEIAMIEEYKRLSTDLQTKVEANIRSEASRILIREKLDLTMSDGALRK